MVDLVGAIVHLKKERSKLVHQLSELGATESGDLTGDLEFGEGFADAAAANAERAEVLGIIRNLRELLSEVDVALAKAADGTHGICEHCGKEIPPARMKYRPASLYHVDCKTTFA